VTCGISLWSLIANLLPLDCALEAQTVAYAGMMKHEYFLTREDGWKTLKEQIEHLIENVDRHDINRGTHSFLQVWRVHEM
jgi:hypothetical protein